MVRIEYYLLNGVEMKTKYNNIAALYKAVQAGEIDESKIEIWVDNDSTSIYLNDADIDDLDPICKGHGNDDVTVLYDLLFPKAMVSNV